MTLTAEQTAELTRRRRAPKTKPRTRDRLEMVRLSAAGWNIPKIAQHFGLTESRVRHWIKTFLTHGFDGLSDRKGNGPKRRLTGEILEQIRQTLEQDGRTWTAGQVNDWLLEHHGFRMNSCYLSEVLGKSGMSYKRTTRPVQHKQKSEQVSQRKADLETLKKGHKPG